MNNYEEIKSMNIPEMASFLANVIGKEICDFCANNNCIYDSCAEGLIKWLERESETLDEYIERKKKQKAKEK